MSCEKAKSYILVEQKKVTEAGDASVKNDVRVNGESSVADDQKAPVNEDDADAKEFGKRRLMNKRILAQS